MNTLEPLQLDRFLPTDGTTERPPEIPRWLMRFSAWMLRRMGWRIYGQLPNVPKSIFIAVPHTSNMDGPIMLLTSWSYGVRPTWMVKAEIVRGLIGRIIIALGGMPIDRRKSHNVVDEAARMFGEYERIALVIAPEGTRKYAEYWKTGGHPAFIQIL
ncbi:MAG: 1-acyl-sn-glycerol-3-phosphate acyltransferase [Anaerolineae bacterium]|nr:1-acyl-sn-glycerol-3-phosphate acyltransferase [Anaerolineae bacterium]